MGMRFRLAAKPLVMPAALKALRAGQASLPLAQTQS